MSRFDLEELVAQAKLAARIEAVKDWTKALLAALAIGLIMSSPLWMQAVFCICFKECS